MYNTRVEVHNRYNKEYTWEVQLPTMAVRYIEISVRLVCCSECSYKMNWTLVHCSREDRVVRTGHLLWGIDAKKMKMLKLHTYGCRDCSSLPYAESLFIVAGILLLLIILLGISEFWKSWVLKVVEFRSIKV